MDEPIIVRYRWTPDELLAARRWHRKRAIRAPYWAGLHLIFGLVAFLGVLGVLTRVGIVKPHKDHVPLWATVLCLLAGIQWFVIRPLFRRRDVERQFRKQPALNTEMYWQFTPESVVVANNVATMETRWEGILRVAQCPGGFLLYQSEGYFYWLPQHGFASHIDFDRFGRLAREKVTQFVELH